MAEQKILLTMLNAMAGGDIEAACGKLAEWNIRVLDLKDSIFGKAVERLSVEDAHAMRNLADAHNMQIHTLSTCLFFADIEEGEAAFRERYAKDLENIVSVAGVLNPHFVRLLAASSSRRDILSRREEFSNSADYVADKHPWVLDVYREAIDRINGAGYRVAIENEVHRCLFANPTEVLDFLRALERPLSSVCLTWDIQNLWQMGTYPTLEVYRQLRPVIGMIHLKGGRSDSEGGPLRWRSDLKDASWPLLDIVRAVAADGVSPVICLNPSHGAHHDDYRGDFKADVDYLRKSIPEIE